METGFETGVVPLRIERPEGAAPRVEAPRMDLVGELREAIEGEVRFDAASRALYATDSSNYRQTPIGVVIPRTLDDVVKTVALCRRHGVPILSRAGGTSLAGQTCNVAVVMDWSKYLHGILGIDPVGRTATVLPGTILDTLRGVARDRYQLTLGPDPSTHDRCCIGGMIGNNSCGTHAQMAGKMSENTHALEILTYDGLRTWVGPTSDEEFQAIVRAGGRKAEIYQALQALRDEYADEIRARFPKIPRRVSGYNLDQLLPENGFHVARALVGTEGTCVTVLQAKVRLVYDPPHRALLVIGYDDIYEAADRIGELDEFQPLALEGMDQGLIQRAKKKHLHTDFLSQLPEGGGFLIVEFGGETREEARANATDVMHKIRREKGLVDSKVFDDPVHQSHIWTVRESGLGATARVPGMRDTWEGWEDSAVPPEKLGGYLRDFRKLLDRYGYDAALYGHFGQGCLHCRIDFVFETEEGRRTYRSFIEDAADLVVSYGGSLSGEHGDGQSRAELLPKMFGDRLVGAFEKFKGIWDPDWKMNPRKDVRPYRIDENLRIVPPRWNPKTHFRFPDDDGRMGRATMRCVGVGLCRRDEGGVMCPSYMVTKEEKHSTRGRAHLLFEMLQGQTLERNWRDEGVKEALDLCLVCKGCKGECPINVDIPTYKAEFLSHYYEGRLRPRQAYTMGLTMFWLRMARVAPWAGNLLMRSRAGRAVIRAIAGVDPRRELPRLAPRSFQQRLGFRRPNAAAGERKVVLWPDTWNNYFHPETAQSAYDFLTDAGWKVIVPRGFLCCGRPLYDYGMLPTAKRLLRHDIAQLRPYIADGTPIVGLEPSCISVFHDELHGLFPDDPEAMKLKDLVMSFEEFLEKEKIDVPRLEMKALVQGHCHSMSTTKLRADKAVMDRMGLHHEVPESGCCGMAGAFGYEAGQKYDVSMACGERVILPMVRDEDRDALVIADGFSCRSQIEDTTDRRAIHLAEALRFAQHHGPLGTTAAYPEEVAAQDEKRAHPEGARPPIAPLAVLAGGAAAALGFVTWRRAFR